METIFIQLAAILLVAFVVSYIIKTFNQPLIIGYILAGILVSPFILMIGGSTEIIKTLSEFGIAFLLFIVGLHLNPKVLKEIGWQSIVIGIIQIAITFGLGFIISWKIIGWGILASSIIGIALALSSTIVIMKLLSDKRQLDSLHGKISVGILIVQDIVAALVLMAISSLNNGSEFKEIALKSILSGGALVLGVIFIGYFILPKITKNIARSLELLFLFSISWCFVIAALFNALNFSIEIGALVAGVALSVSPYSTEISSRIRPLRDFFLIIFFIILGLNMEIQNISKIAQNALILSGIALIIKPLIIMGLMGAFKYTKRVSFLTGTSMGQISEFSLIILMMAISTGYASSEMLHTITLTLILTIALSSYMITYSRKFYKMMSGFASLFERKDAKRRKTIEKKYDAILFGYNRIGFNLLNSFKKIHKNYLVVDFNPDTIAELEKQKIPCLYGDADDPDVIEDLPLDKVKLVVSTVPDYEANELLLENVKRINPNAIVITRAHSIRDAFELYDKDSDYVLTPHFLGGEHLSKMIKEIKTNHNKYKKERKKHIKLLGDILKKTKNKKRLTEHSTQLGRET